MLTATAGACLPSSFQPVQITLQGVAVAPPSSFVSWGLKKKSRCLGDAAGLDEGGFECWGILQAAMKIYRIHYKQADRLNLLRQS